MRRQTAEGSKTRLHPQQSWDLVDETGLRRHQKPQKETIAMTNRRDFLKTGRCGDGCPRRARAALSRAGGASVRVPIKWRLQTYAGRGAGRTCGQAGDRSLQQGCQRRDGHRALYFADQLVPTGELFRAMQNWNHRRRAERRGLHGGAGRCLPSSVATSRSPPAIRWTFLSSSTSTA